MQDTKGKLYLLNRRGEERIKVSKEFETTRNNWGTFNNKFVNIDDNDQLIAIDLSGKIKTGNPDLGTPILSDIKYHTLAAVTSNKLLINKKVIDLDLGTYGRPHIYKAGNRIYIFIANQDNHKIYAFDTKGNLFKNFPIIGQVILDLKADKNNRYLLVYDADKNLIVYKL
jgi:outer membrane protein assembly factor BamB